MPSRILGISAFYHDSAAALLIDGEVRGAVQEERFTRKKHDPSFPVNAIRFLFEDSGVSVGDLDAVVFYEKPFVKFERLLETYHGFAPRGLPSFLAAMPVWIKQKLFLRKLIKDQMALLGPGNPEILFPEHHLSHAAGAFYPSPFSEAAILTVDGVGEWATTTIGHGRGSNITILRELEFPHSLGLLYSAFTYYCGFKVNSGEYKLMGLAPYGDPDSEETKRWKRLILDELVDLREDGSLLLNMDYFDFATGLRMCRDDVWESLFGLRRRLSESELTRGHMNMALAIQQITEETVLRMAGTAKTITGSRNLTMAGGVALNCVANGKLIRQGEFEDVWIQPAAGDAGGALGAALAGWYIWRGSERVVDSGIDGMQGAYCGPEYGLREILRTARRYNAQYEYFPDENDLYGKTAGLLAEGNAVGWFQGRMEFGPRALGNRSILGDPGNPEMQKKLNLKIKYRESFRPFAPAVLAEDASEYFDIDRPSPYMLLVAPVRGDRRNDVPDGYAKMDMYERLYQIRSDIPAVTHVDFSARIQTVHRETNERFWRLLNAFKARTGRGVLVNTSFNVRGEPIVCSPDDAYRCFMRTEMDYLVLGDCLFSKNEQPQWREEADWMKDYELD